MINITEVLETNKMIEQENLDVRTITMGISLLDCIDSDLDTMNEKIYNKITTKAKDLVATGDEIAAEFGIALPFESNVNKYGSSSSQGSNNIISSSLHLPFFFATALFSNSGK